MEWLPACGDSAEMQGQSQIAALVNPANSDPLNQKRFHESDMDMGPEGKRPPAMGDPFGAGLAPMRDNGSGVGGLGGGVGSVESEDMTVPDRMVGLIIGRGGESISRLQAESGAKIQMSPQAIEMSNERLCTLTGPRVAIERAKELINAIVASRANERDRDRMMGGGGGGGGLGDMMVGGGDQPGQTTAEMIVPSSKVGLIIGKGGETIKQLQDKSGSKMVVIQDGIYANALEKPLRISGDPKQIEHAKQLVFELMAEKDNFGGPGGRMGNFGGRGFGGGTTAEITVPQAAVGVVIGKGGEMIKKIQNDTGANIQFQQNISGRNERTAAVSGTPDQIEHAKVIVQDLIESVMKRDQQMGGFGGGGGGGGRNGNWGGGGGGGGGVGFGRGPMGRDSKQEISFPVPANKCGIVIGKGGETIKAINMQSGAHCELDRRPPPNPNEKIFLVKGGPDQVEHAKRLICEKVGIPYGPGGPGGPGGPFGGPGGPPGGPGGPGGYPPQGWGNNFHQPGVWGQQPNEPGKQENSWNSYYPQYYGGQGTQAPGAAARQQPQSSPATGSSLNPQTGQPDYSSQWAEYYRNMGMVREAEAIEQQIKLKTAGAGGPGGPPAAAAAAAAAAGQPAANGTQADYSAQWVEYYRSQGMMTEAENLEQQIKLSKQQQQQQQQPSAAPAASVAGGAPAGFQPQQHSFAGGYGAGAPGGYGQYGAYPGAGDN